MAVDTTKLIDDRNRILWNEIISKYQVAVHQSQNSEYSCYSKSNAATFFVPIDNLCRDSFTHELLHIYIRLKEVYIGSNLILRVSGSKVLQKIFNERLLEHIGNCLDHMKMLPIYLEMGFDRSKFLLDYHTHKCTDKEIGDIKRFYKIGNRYNAQAVEIFIAKFFAIKADPNLSFDYNNCLLKLKKIDERLHVILNEFISSWEIYDLNKNDVFYNYRDLVDNLYDGLISWMRNKEFI